jgi:hypothetical protein
MWIFTFSVCIQFEEMVCTVHYYAESVPPNFSIMSKSQWWWWVIVSHVLNIHMLFPIFPYLCELWSRSIFNGSLLQMSDYLSVHRSWNARSVRWNMGFSARELSPMWFAHVMTQILSRLDEAEMMTWVMLRVICGWRCGIRLLWGRDGIGWWCMCEGTLVLLRFQWWNQGSNCPGQVT